MKTGVLCGTFDLLHIGHLNIIRNAHSRCDRLIIGVNSDENVMRRKNKRPIMPDCDRLEIIKSLKFVDEAFIITGGMEFIEHLISMNYKLDEYYRGTDAAGTDESHREDVILTGLGIKPEYISHTPGMSSTIIRNILNEGKATDETNVF